MTLSGWLTTFGFEVIRIMASNYAYVPSTHAEFIDRYVVKRSTVAGVDASDAPVVVQTISPEDPFPGMKDFITGFGLTWPTFAVREFETDLFNLESMKRIECQAFQKYFSSRLEHAEQLETLISALQQLNVKHMVPNCLFAMKSAITSANLTV
jgi:hypothetical protein